MNDSRDHTPVLVRTVLASLATAPGRCYIDATVGLGGHAEAILQVTAPDGRLLGIDADPEAVARSRARLARFAGRALVTQGNFRELETIATASGFAKVDGVLFDLGVSSFQLSAAGRGFSFQHPAPLDMRMDPSLGRTAADLVNQLSEADLEALVRRYGEDPAARRIARAVVRQRPITSTAELAQVVAAAAGGRGRARTHPATRTFQALRIAVNDELGALSAALAATIDLVRTGGRLAVISFHSLEDRIVKDFLRRESRDCICPPSLPACACSHRATLRLLGRSASKPDADEVARNVRSRSARLRVAERL